MEEISYNIPVIATDVGSSSEIVTPETGLLISANPTLIEIKKAYTIKLKAEKEDTAVLRR